MSAPIKMWTSSGSGAPVSIVGSSTTLPVSPVTLPIYPGIRDVCVVMKIEQADCVYRFDGEAFYYGTALTQNVMCDFVLRGIDKSKKVMTVHGSLHAQLQGNETSTDLEIVVETVCRKIPVQQVTQISGVCSRMEILHEGNRIYHYGTVIFSPPNAIDLLAFE